METKGSLDIRMAMKCLWVKQIL